MKRLIVFRHAKSDWSAEYSHDRERPLAPRGERAAGRMGRFLSASGFAPDRVISSPALRARETARRAAAAGGWECPVEIAEELYSGSLASILRLAARLSDAESTLLVASHEPICSELVAGLVGGGDFKLPTAAMARIDLPITTWKEVAPGHGILAWLVTPKLLGRAAGD